MKKHSSSSILSRGGTHTVLSNDTAPPQEWRSQGKKLFTFFSLFVLLVTLTGYLLYDGIIWFNNPSKTEYPVRGIDISHYQGAIDWELLKEEKLSFIYIKATEGGDYKDTHFSENWDNAIKSGHYVGAYHFYRPCTDWELQAGNVISTVPKSPQMLPLVLDLEFIGNCKTPRAAEEIRRDIRSLSQRLSEHYGAAPLFYVTEEFYERYLIGHFDDIGLWYRDIFTKPQLKDGRDWLIWQYSNRGHIRGIKGYVDQNVYNGDLGSFKKLLHTAPRLNPSI